MGLSIKGSSASGGGGSGAPTDATFITQTANGDLSAEQALGALATGILKSTTTTGVVSIAVPGTDYSVPSAKTTASNYTIGTTSALEPYGGIIYVTGACTLTIPAVANNMRFTVITRGAFAVSVDPNASDLLDLDGTPLADGHKATNTSTTGDIAVFTSLNDGTGFFCSSNSWTDGG